MFNGVIYKTFVVFFLPEDQLIMVCLDIFIAGSQTTSNTLDFAFLMMILHPNIQSKVQKCLDLAFEDVDYVSYAAKSRYVNFFIWSSIFSEKRQQNIVLKTFTENRKTPDAKRSNFVPKSRYYLNQYIQGVSFINSSVVCVLYKNN